MTGIVASSGAIAAYAATTEAVAAQVEGAAAAMVASGPVVLTPVLGLIGSDFLAAFSGAHTAHTAAVDTLGAVIASIGGAALTSAVSYASVDATTAESIGAESIGAQSIGTQSMGTASIGTHR